MTLINYEERDIIKKYYVSHGSNYIQGLIPRLSLKQIRGFARNMGIVKFHKKIYFDKTLIKRLHEEYPELGPKGFSKKYNITEDLARNKAYDLGIKMIRHNKISFCDGCGKSINPYATRKRNLCKSCSAKVRMNKIRLEAFHYGKLFTNKELDFIKENYYNMSKDKMVKHLNRTWCSIMHKAHRLKLKRNPKFNNEWNPACIKWKKNNPMHNPIYKAKAHKKLKALYERDPTKLLNARLTRDHMTQIEKIMAKLLDELGVKYLYNKYVKTKKKWRFPDFRIDNLVIECDGEYWHKKNLKQDMDRQKELEDIGLRVIRFSDKEILKDLDNVRKVIKKELKLN